MPLADFTLQFTLALRIIAASRTRMRVPPLVRFEFDQIAPVVAICRGLVLGPRIRDDRDLENHIAYVHSNPVKHRYVNDARDWPHSSVHRIFADAGRSLP